jgi:hypothetical protein
VADRTPTPPTRSPSAPERRPGIDAASGNGEASAGPPHARRAYPAGVLDDLERLADLRDRGAVTEEEFQRMKRELLDRM